MALRFGLAGSASWHVMARSFRLARALHPALLMLTILLILLLLAAIGGGLGHSRFGYAGWSPAGVILLVVVVMLLTGTRI